MGSTQPVFDYTAAEPWLVSDRMRETFERSRDAGATVGAAWDRMEGEKARQLREDPTFREQVRKIYTKAGVNLISPTLSSRDPSVNYATGVQRDLSRWQTRFDSVNWLEKVTTPAETRKITERGNGGVVLNTQNLGAAIDGDVSQIDELFDAGIRIFQLTYNRQNHLGTGCNDSSRGGLSDRGHEAIDRLNDLGGIVDLSHCGRQTTLDTVSYSSAPVAYTHTSCTSLSEHFRGKSDEELSVLSGADGYMGIVGLPWFLILTDIST
jgi:membrane dipeptidase